MCTQRGGCCIGANRTKHTKVLKTFLVVTPGTGLQQPNLSYKRLSLLGFSEYNLEKLKSMTPEEIKECRDILTSSAIHTSRDRSISGTVSLKEDRLIRETIFFTTYTIRTRTWGLFAITDTLNRKRYIEETQSERDCLVRMIPGRTKDRDSYSISGGKSYIKEDGRYTITLDRVDRVHEVWRVPAKGLSIKELRHRLEGPFETGEKGLFGRKFLKKRGECVLQRRI